MMNIGCRAVPPVGAVDVKLVRCSSRVALIVMLQLEVRDVVNSHGMWPAWEASTRERCRVRALPEPAAFGYSAVTRSRH